MSDAERNGPATPPSSSGAADLESRRKAFASGLAEAQQRHAPPVDSGRPSGAFGIAMRLAIELVAGVAVGGAIGWGLDALIGTKPFLFLLFLGLGMAAGIMNVFRSARRMNEGVGQAGGGTHPRAPDEPGSDA